MNSAIAEGKYEHTDANVIWNVEVRSLILRNEEGIGTDDTLQGRSNVGITRSCDVEGLHRGENSSLSLQRLRIEENLRYEEKCKLLELIASTKRTFLQAQGDATCLNIDLKCKAGYLNHATVVQYYSRYGVKSGNK